MRVSSDDIAITAVPALRYRDLPGAIEWLCGTLGFEQQLLVRDEDGTIRYAELILGSSMVMLVPVRNSAFDDLMVQPDEIGGAETQVCYYFVSDIDTYFDRICAAGAEIVLDLTDAHHRGRGFSCRDPEGHLWSFGSYDPWARRSMARECGRRPSVRAALPVGMGLAAIAFLAAALWAFGTGRYAEPAHASLSTATVSLATDEKGARLSAPDQRALETAEGTVREARAELARTLARAKESEQAAADLRTALATAYAAQEAAERSRRNSLAELSRQQTARDAAEKTIKEADEKLAFERNQRRMAERTARTLRLQLSRSRGGPAGRYENGASSLFKSWMGDDG
jgi:uncharacterized glyoxalase superfamily protein PhnB